MSIAQIIHLAFALIFQLALVSGTDTGFSKVVKCRSEIIVPDITKRSEYITSQLSFADGAMVLSRQILYISEKRPQMTLVLPLDATRPAAELAAIIYEREEYCKYHNYGLFARYMQDFAAEGAQASEDALALAPIRMLRQAMAAFPRTQLFWLYTAEGHAVKIENEHMVAHDSTQLEPALIPRLETEKVSIGGLSENPDDAHVFVAFDDKTGYVSSESIVVKQTSVSKAFLEIAADPLFEDYEPFHDVEDPAGIVLTHIARWHPFIASYIALLSPQTSGIQDCDEEKAPLHFCKRSQTK